MYMQASMELGPEDVSLLEGIMSYPSFLGEVGEHDNTTRVLLPNHPPEIMDCAGKWALSCNVYHSLLVALNREREGGTEGMGGRE